MKRKLEILVLILFCAGISLCFINLWVGILILVLMFILCFAAVIFVLLNAALKRTNWYKNVFVFTRQMCSNAGYREYMIRNLEIVNVGSNPARFAFHYDDVLGENWSTGNQGKDMDFEILKFRHSFIKKGGVVLLPIVPFSSVAGYLKKYKPEYLGIKYYAKFAHTLDYSQARNIPECRDAFRWIKYPLFYEKRALKYIVRDEQPDTRLSIADMTMMYPQLVEDARHMIESWLKEFNLKTIHDELSSELKEGFEISVRMMQTIIDFLVERELKPVIVLPPMSAPLQAYFTDHVKQRLLYSFIDSINRPKVLFLDYSNEKEFQDPQLYFNALLMNLRGRKQFTKRVLKDLGLV